MSGDKVNEQKNNNDIIDNTPIDLVNVENTNKTPNDEVKIQTVNIDGNSEITAKEYVEEEKYKVTGTVNESELTIKEEKLEDEIIDEHAIKRDVQISDSKFKYNITYMIVFILVILLFVFLMPYIIKIIGM